MKKDKRNPKLILLDLGGVLIEVVSVKRLAALMHSMPFSVIKQKWTDSVWLKQFESGQCDTDTFAKGIVNELGLDVPPQAFMKEFELFLRGFYEGAENILRELKDAGYKMACITDTNIFQWTSLCKRTGIDTYFDYQFLSYEIGAMKPDSRVFDYVTSALPYAHADIIYFDDREANVLAGSAAGWEAYEVNGVVELKEKLKGLGLL